MPVLSKRIVLDCFYLLIFYFDKFSTDVCRLPYAVNVNLNLSILRPLIARFRVYNIVSHRGKATNNYKFSNSIIKVKILNDNF